MLKNIDRFLAVLLLLGAAGHTYGTFSGYPFMAPIFIWSLAGTLAAALLGAVNLLRINRPADRPLAWICFFGSLCWVGIAVGFGIAIGSPADPRVLIHAISALGLAVFSLRAAVC